jgi:hypothetical protein
MQAGSKSRQVKFLRSALKDWRLSVLAGRLSTIENSLLLLTTRRIDFLWQIHRSVGRKKALPERSYCSLSCLLVEQHQFRLQALQASCLKGAFGSLLCLFRMSGVYHNRLRGHIAKKLSGSTTYPLQGVWKVFSTKFWSLVY